MAARQLLADYGEDVTTVRGAHHHLRLVEQAPSIATVEQYVGICRRIDWRLDWRNDDAYQDGSADGRLIAAGFQRVPPRQWVERDLPRLVRYVAEAWPGYSRGWGSDYCPGSPQEMWHCLCAGVPAHHVTALGAARCLRVPWHRRRIMVRAASRTSLWGHGWRPLPADWYTDKLLLAFGRLCPELQRVAISTIPRWLLSERERYDGHLPPPGGHMRTARVNDVDWARVAAAQRTLLADRSGRVRAAMARGRRREDLLDGRPLCPAYPSVPEELGEALALGVRPVELGSGLRSREAHWWLTAGAQGKPHQWLAWYLGLPDWWPRGRSVAAVRWLAAVAHDPQRRRALERHRIIRDPHGEEIRVRYLDRMDEVQEEDLPQGVRTGVETAIRRAAERLGRCVEEEWSEDYRQLAPPPPWWPRVRMRCARLLDSPARLVEQGRREHHCVAMYSDAVRRGESVIVAFDVLGHRSTVELNRHGGVRQHYAAHNAQPHELCVRALRTLQRRISP